MSRGKRIKATSLPLGVAAAALCYGSSVNALDFDFNLGVSTEWTDNAERTASDGLDERQDEYQLGIAAEHLQGNVEYSINYTARESRFNEDSQEDRSTIDGEAFVRYMNPANPFHISLSHTRNRVLSRRQDLDLLANLDERSILTGVPGIQYRVSPRDNLSLNATISEISYRFAGERDSRQNGVQFEWRHRLSAVDQFSLSIQSIETEFQEIDGFDYEYDSAQLFYSAQLRKLSYSIGVGYITSSGDQREDFDGPNYSLDLTYETGFHRITLQGQRRITDTSLGNAGDNLLDSLTSADGTVDSFDRFELSSLEVDWTTPILCDRCDLNVSLGFTSEEYSEDSVQDNSEHFGSVGMDYRISNFSRLGFFYTRSEQKFDDSTLAEDFERDSYELRFGHDFTVDTSFQIFIRQEERTSQDPTNEYEEFIVGLALDQRF